ncbi:MAG: hypothetical protein PHC75_00630 [Burkholderiales bacterium]|nr:hypothetical protein [Burkholderiales bacterium]
MLADKVSLKKHLFIALILGLVLRTLTAYFDYGPFALDDYLHGLIPAFMLENYGVHILPEYRSWLLVWILNGFLKLCSCFGVNDSLSQIRIMLTGLGVISLTAIIGCYLYVKNFNNKLFQLTSLYLISAYPLMLLVSTRAFGETVSMSFLLFGIGISEHARFNHKTLNFIIGMIILGIACLLRFQVAVFWLAYAICLLLINWRSFLPKILISGIVVILLQIVIDLLSSRAAFSTIIAYLQANEGGAAGYGVTPWYSTWLLVLAFILAPFSLPFFRNFKSLLRSHWVTFIPFFVFVLAHSLVPHKEERFMFPIVGIELIFLAWLWMSDYKNNWATKIFNWVIACLGGVALFVVCFVNFQSGAVDPMFKTSANKIDTLVLADEWNTWDGFYPILITKNSKVEQVDIKNKLSYNAFRDAANSFKQVIVVSSNPDLSYNIDDISKNGLWELKCSKVYEATSLVDEIAYKLNPKHNKRRAPVQYIVCK